MTEGNELSLEDGELLEGELLLDDELELLDDELELLDDELELLEEDDELLDDELELLEEDDELELLDDELELPEDDELELLLELWSVLLLEELGGRLEPLSLLDELLGLFSPDHTYVCVPSPCGVM